MKSIYCPKCDRSVEVALWTEECTLEVRNRTVVAEQIKAICPSCGDNIADEAMTKRNIDAALNAYRSLEHLLSPEEIKNAYAKYGLTQGSFAKLLGLGAVTISRYEHGAVQTRQIDMAIRKASNPEALLSLLDEHIGQISQDQWDAAYRAAQEMLAANGEVHSAVCSEIGNLRVELVKQKPCMFNGFRSADWNRIAQMSLFFASKCKNLGKIKLNKAFFYADFACFAATSCSISGLMYARATFGPVVDNFDALFGELVKSKVLEEKLSCVSDYESIIYKPGQEFNGGVFNNEEFEILNNVASFINGFATASALSDYSHQEKVWVDHVDGDLISYEGAFDLNNPNQFV